MEPLSNKKFLVLGAARSGLAAVRLLRSCGGDAVLLDEKPLSAFQDIRGELDQMQVPCFFGEDMARAPIEEAGALIISPGVPIDHPLVRKARQRGIDIIGELELGFRFAKCRLAAITGTNGKTTTVHLAADILMEGGIPSAPVGNVGFPLAQAVLVPRWSDPHACLVTEVSSFQLETVRTFHPRVAVLLNFTPDHLDRHGSLDVYRDMKYRITENQTGEDFLILNRDDPVCLGLGERTKARVMTFSLKDRVPCGAYCEGDRVRLCLEEDIPLLPFADIPIPGMHNIQNVLASSLVGMALGVEPEAIASAIRRFPGVEHRIEFVLSRHGVDFYNDSKATNLDSMEKALLSFTRPVILIAGGKDKGCDYNTLNPLIRERVKSLIVMGEAAPLILKAWENLVPSFQVGDMGEAVQKAYELASTGEVILFSPGCSSFDAYQNFEHRGRVFKDEVRKLSREKEMIAT
jgi:UDP-N-acetylmuramoylalanine--D-glutamate ligase